MFAWTGNANGIRAMIMALTRFGPRSDCNLHSDMESTSEKILYDIFVPTEWEEPVTIEVSCRLDVVP